MCHLLLLTGMLRCVVLLFALHLTGDTTPLSLAANLEFVLEANPPCGPIRLPGVWLAPSLVSCIVSCVSSVLDNCRCVLYNSNTRLCTPGQGLDPSQPIPSAEEGSLYMVPTCDSYRGFSLASYGSTEACVFYQIKPLNYTDAQAFCASMNAFLYTVKNMDRFHLLQNIFKEGLWLGLNDMAKEGEFVWSDGEVNSENLTAMFRPGEPNDYNKEEDCICMLLPKPPLLNDDSCYKKYNSVCERPV